VADLSSLDEVRRIAVLTTALREMLIASAPARVVTVASEAARHAGSIDWPARA
jgi:hypothetical protein